MQFKSVLCLVALGPCQSWADKNSQAAVPVIEVYSESPSENKIPEDFWKDRGVAFNRANPSSKVLSPSSRDLMLRESGLWADFEFQDHFAKDSFLLAVKTKSVKEIVRLYPNVQPRKIKLLKEKLR